ncbi:aromatic-ring-hydroxylating dioxygenase subunit beta [Nocardia sp. CA-290969]|uniref:aromatic-ring-hydroxylating dioxygenase subunit beta n=1 Tax=Nocardia sp. CA-290969 TaxID=3239986 RepID=UPI003D925B3F
MNTSPAEVDRTQYDAGLNAVCAAFLYREAELLDRRKFDDWLSMLHPELIYEIPVRVTVGAEDLTNEFRTDSVHARDSYRSLEMRVRRLQTEHAFAENPPSRTSRMVTNVQSDARDDGDVEVRSKFLMHRSYGSSTNYELIAGDRHDLLRPAGASFHLVHRTVYLAHTTIPTINLGVFL